MSESTRLHQKLFILVENELHPSMSQYRGVIAAAHVHLPTGVLSTCNSSMALLRALQDYGKIRVGHYTALKDILEDARMIALKCKVEDQEKLVHRALSVESRAARARQQTTERLVLTEDELFNPGETVAKQPESAAFETGAHALGQISDIWSSNRRQDIRETVAKQPESAVFEGSDFLKKIDDMPYTRRQYYPDNIVAKQPESGFLPQPRDERFHVPRENMYKSSHIFKIVQRSDACKDWRPLGRELGVDDAEFDAIALDYPQQLREQCYQMLRTWVQSAGSKATPKLLITALKSLTYNKVAEEIIDYFTDRPFEV